MNWALLAGSLAGVLGLAGLAWLLGLGGGAIGSTEEAMRIAAADTGCDPAEALVSRDGRAAVVRARDGALILLKQHGTQVAARRLAWPRIELSGGGVRVHSGERMFGTVALQLADEERDKLLTML